MDSRSDKTNEIRLIIKLPPVTKKNSMQIIQRGKCQRPLLIPSKQYRQYESNAGWFLKPLAIARPVNIKALYFMPTRRKVDITNLESALLDVLVKHGVIADDNCHIVVSTDGSRVMYDKENPRTEVYITDSKETMQH